MHLNRALSKLGILSRSQATAAILAGRVTVDGRVVRDPARPVHPERANIELDATAVVPAASRTILLNKPRGVLTTRHDPAGRQTIYDIVGPSSNGLVAVGRLDLATTGLLLLTSNTAFAHWATDPLNRVPRVYIATVRGRVTDDERRQMLDGISDGGELLTAAAIVLRKASARESHLTVELHEGKNREVRRLCAAVGHEVTRLKRVRFGGLDLGTLAPGAWREVSQREIASAFPSFKV